MNTAATNNMNDILTKLNQKISCGADCQTKKKTEDLKKKMLDAEKRGKNSNQEIELAKKNYYTYIGGEPAYDNIKLSEYTQYTSDYAQTENSNKSELDSEMEELLERYEFDTEHISSINELLVIKQEENKVLETKIDDYEKLTFTSQRKVVYENHDMTRIMTYNKILVFIYYGLFIYYLATGNFFSDKLYKDSKLVAILLIYLIFPFTLHFLIQKLFDIKNIISYFFNNKVYKNVYTNV
jgi:hypothetical protein